MGYWSLDYNTRSDINQCCYQLIVAKLSRVSGVLIFLHEKDHVGKSVLVVGGKLEK